MRTQRVWMTASGVTLAATVQVAADEAPLVALLAALAVLLLLVTRGFAPLADRPASTSAGRVPGETGPRSTS